MKINKVNFNNNKQVNLRKLKEVLKSQENVGDAKIYSAVSNKLKIFNV